MMEDDMQQVGDAHWQERSELDKRLRESSGRWREGRVELALCQQQLCMVCNVLYIPEPPNISLVRPELSSGTVDRC